MDSHRWRPGDVVVLRYVETPTSARMVHAIMGDPASPGSGEPFLVSGNVVTVQARPYRVIRDEGYLTALFQPEGTELPRWQIAEHQYLWPAPPRTRGETIRLLYPSKPYDVTLFFETASEPPWFFTGLFEGAGLVPGWRDRRPQFVNEAIGRNGTPGRFRGWYINIASTFRRPEYGFDFVDLTLDIVVRPDRSWYWKDTDELAHAVAMGACSSEFARRLREAGEEVLDLVASGGSPFDDQWTLWRPPSNWRIDGIPDGWQFPPALIRD